MTTSLPRPKRHLFKIITTDVAPNGSVTFKLDPEPSPDIVAQIRSQVRLELNTLVRATLTPAQMRTILERALARISQ